MAERYCVPESGPLAIQFGRIVRHGEVDLQDLPVGDLGRIVGDLHGFRMARPARADIVIVRRRLVAARKTRNHVRNALNALENSLDAPEAAACENRRGLRLGGGHRRIHAGIWDRTGLQRKRGQRKQSTTKQIF